MKVHFRPDLLLVALVAAVSVAWSQEPKAIPASEANRHLIKSVAPDYPKMAEIAHIQGRVQLTATISREGAVTDVKAFMGHPLLLNSALQAVKQWTYQPFVVDGVAVPVRTPVYLLFVTGPGAEEARKYFLQEIECTDLLHAKRFDEAASSCNNALQTANQLGSDPLSFKADAYSHAGQAAFQLTRFSEAVQDFQESLKLGKRDSFEAHHDLAAALRSAGQAEQAESEYRACENALDGQSKQLQQINSDEVRSRQKAQLQKRLSQILQEHAALLREMGRNTEADNLERQAKSLEVSN